MRMLKVLPLIVFFLLFILKLTLSGNRALIILRLSNIYMLERSYKAAVVPYVILRSQKVHLEHSLGSKKYSKHKYK